MSSRVQLGPAERRSSVVRPIRKGRLSIVDRIQAHLPSVLGPSPTRTAISAVVDAFVRIATAYLLAEIRRGRIRLSQFHLEPTDLAIDCIAQLFERDDQGRFARLINYFDESIEELTEEELLHRSRRLVGSAVEDGLFRRYKEHDPPLARMIRSIRRAAKGMPDASVERVNGRLWLVVDREADRGALPLVRERLEAYLAPRLRETATVTQMVRHAVAILKQETDVQPRYPLVGLALAFRSSLTRLNGALPRSVAPSPRLEELEAKRVIRSAVERVREDYRGTYVGKGKLSESTYQAYVQAVEDLLLASYDGDGSETVMHGCLRRYIPGLTNEEYRRRHRTRCEYLLRLARERIRLERENMDEFSADRRD